MFFVVLNFNNCFLLESIQTNEQLQFLIFYHANRLHNSSLQYFHLLDQVLREKWSFRLKLNYASVNFFYVKSQRINMFFYLTVKKFPCYLPIMKSHRNYSPMAFDFPFILNSQLIWCNQSIYVKRSPITLISLLSRTFASQTIKSITPVIVFII